MNASDVDWRDVLNSWSRADILYLKAVCDEKLSNTTARRKISISGDGVKLFY